MAQFWQRQKPYMQVTALGPLAKVLRSTSITPDTPRIEAVADNDNDAHWHAAIESA